VGPTALLADVRDLAPEGVRPGAPRHGPERGLVHTGRACGYHYAVEARLADDISYQLLARI